MKTITAGELLEKVNKGDDIHIIDVREDIEVAAGKIPAAKHIALSNLPNAIEQLDKHTHYYIVCHSGGRSSLACEFLTSQGYQVTNVVDGMEAWQGEIR